MQRIPKRGVRLLVGGALVVAAAAPAVTASGAQGPPRFAPPVRLPKAITHSVRSTEPRVAIGPDGHRWLIATHGPTTDRRAIVYNSTNGRHWTLTPSDPADQTRSSYDVDIAVTPGGRLIAVELDYAGINFRVSYSDDGGKTWNGSAWSTFADTDRPYIAVGPTDEQTHQPRVYLLFHNLATGAGNHNMFVQTSTNGGESFGAPVPITLPGSQAYADLQCADSGGPSDLFVDHNSGRVYAVWGTRGSGPGGGCGSAASAPEANVVGATRVWVASSPNGSQGSWKTSLAVDDAKKGNITGMQLSPGAVDSAGNVYVFYTESPHPYPDYSGAALRYRWAGPDLRHWSAPVTVAPAGGAGNVLPHVIAGEPGKLDFAWYAGTQQGPRTVWHPVAAQTVDGLTGAPHVATVRLSSLPTYTGSASDLMGVCGKGPTAPLQSGTTCERSADLFGIALDPHCYLTVAWPADKNGAPGSREGTYVSTQTGGPGVC